MQPGSATTRSRHTPLNGFTLTQSSILGPGNQQLTEMRWSGGTAQWAHTNVWANGQLIATYSPDPDQDNDVVGIINFHLTDWLGTRRVLTDYAGNPVESDYSLPYGDGLSTSVDPGAPATTADATPLRFTGKERDTESGNDYFGARYYFSGMGQFLSPDWSAQLEPVPYARLADPQSLNLYSYARNNPLIVVDPDGHCSSDTAAWLNSEGFYALSAASSCDQDAWGNFVNKRKAQQQSGDPTLPTEVQAPPPSWTEKVADFFKPSVSTALMVGTDGLGELPEAGAALSKAAKIEKLTGEANELYPKLAEKADQLHHVIPKYLGGAPDGELAKIPAAYHQLITNAFRTLAPYGQAVSRTAEEVTNIVKQVYSMYPLP